MEKFDDPTWAERLRKAKSMAEVRELMKEIPMDEATLSMTEDDLKLCITAQEIALRNSTSITQTEKTQDG
jgi:hypothetical protein